MLAAPLTTNRFGIAAYDWKLSDQTETGNYSVQLEASDKTELDGKGEMIVPVKRYDLPEFTVSAVLDRGYYLEGQDAGGKDSCRISVRQAGYGSFGSTGAG